MANRTAHDSVQIGRYQGSLCQSEGKTKTDFDYIERGDLFFEVCAEADLLYDTGSDAMVYRTSIDFELVNTLIEMFGVSEGDYTEESINLEVPDTEYWEDIRYLRKMKDYHRDGVRCVFCDEKSKRTSDLLCSLPDRECYTDNGWYKPMLGAGLSGLDALHEDCLAMLLCLAHKVSKDNSTIVMASTV